MPQKALVVSLVVASFVLGTGYLLSEDNLFDFSWDTETQEDEGQQKTLSPGAEPKAAQATAGFQQKPPTKRPENTG